MKLPGYAFTEIIILQFLDVSAEYPLCGRSAEMVDKGLEFWTAGQFLDNHGPGGTVVCHLVSYKSEKKGSKNGSEVAGFFVFSHIHMIGYFRLAWVK